MDVYTLLHSKWITNKALLYNSNVIWHLDGRGVWRRMDTYICMAESHHRSSETITALLIGYTPTENKKFK